MQQEIAPSTTTSITLDIHLSFVSSSRPHFSTTNTTNEHLFSLPCSPLHTHCRRHISLPVVRRCRVSILAHLQHTHITSTSHPASRALLRPSLPHLALSLYFLAWLLYPLRPLRNFTSSLILSYHLSAPLPAIPISSLLQGARRFKHTTPLRSALTSSDNHVHHTEPQELHPSRETGP